MKNVPFEYRICISYILIGAAWILFSDKLLLKFSKDAFFYNIASIYKGWFYVLVTGIFLFLLIKKEIYKRNKLYDELLVANKQALESERLKSAFLSNLSHYIRTPMNSILGFIDLLQSRNTDEEKREKFLNYINEKSHHLLQTINNIVEIAKIQEGQAKIEETVFSINTMLYKLLSEYEHELSGKKMLPCYVTTPVKEGEDRIQSDYGKVYLIFTNLINNAVSFTATGEIEIGYEVAGTQIIFYVRDTGCGITDVEQRTLFSNFFRGLESIQKIKEGSGLGLYLSANLCRLLGGNLWLEYSSPQGSKFCFTISGKKL
jgi:signal transduction histidine kinase